MAMKTTKPTITEVTATKTKLDFFNLNNKCLKERLEKIERIRDFFCYETTQVYTLVSLAWSTKLDYPLGLTFLEILEKMINENLYYLYGSKPSYLQSLLNTLIQPSIKILEFTPSNVRFSLTDFGIAFYWARDGKYI